MSEPNVTAQSPDFSIIVPTRNRPEAVRTLIEACDYTCTYAGSEVVLAVDAVDPALDDYLDLAAEREELLSEGGRGVRVSVTYGPTATMVEALNLAVREVLVDGPYAIGFMGDDHRPQTSGWDSAYVAALQALGTGMVYGNDGHQGERLPTQIAMTANIPRTLGYMAPAGLRHLYVDNFWRDLGEALNILRYLPNVRVTHLHPAAGYRGDEGHARVNAPEVYAADAEAYAAFQAAGQFAEAVERVREAMVVRASHAVVT